MPEVKNPNDIAARLNRMKTISSPQNHELEQMLVADKLRRQRNLRVGVIAAAGAIILISSVISLSGENKSAAISRQIERQTLALVGAMPMLIHPQTGFTNLSANQAMDEGLNVMLPAANSGITLGSLPTQGNFVLSGGANPNQYKITIPTTTVGVCRDLVPKLIGRTSTIQVDGTALTDPNDADTLCTSGGQNAVTLIGEHQDIYRSAQGNQRVLAPNTPYPRTNQVVSGPQGQAPQMVRQAPVIPSSTGTDLVPLRVPEDRLDEVYSRAQPRRTPYGERPDATNPPLDSTNAPQQRPNP